MTKTKKIVLSLLIAAVMLLSAFALMGFTTNTTAYADSKTYFSNEEYTESDRLLNSDGSTSVKTIGTFSNEVKAASIGTAFPELAQVIPRQYLESTQQNAVFQYNGKEYGFYVVKEGDSFDVLLIDFVYEFEDSEEHSNIEYKIRIKPLLQQTFKRSKSNNGDYVWQKAANNYTYYVANPRFLGVVQNENALNYGDNGYNKATDNGVIILQNRINYGIIRYATESDLVQAVGDVALDIAVDVFFDTLDKFTMGATSVLSTMYSYTKNGLEGLNEIMELGKETVLDKNNEANIKTCDAKQQQHDNSLLKGYTRAIAFMPQEEMILSADDNSYAESIIMLNDSNYKSRLTQICEFDIVRRNGNYSSMEHVAGNWYDENAQSLQFSKQRILFEEQEPKFEVTEENVEGDNIPVYLLPNGKQVIEFEPDYSAFYKCDLKNPDGLNLSVIDSDGNTVKNNGYYDLQYGKKYNIIITSGDEKVITSFAVGLADGKTAGMIYANEKRLVKLDVLHSDIYNISANNENCIIENILIKSVTGLKAYSEYEGCTPAALVGVPMQAGEYYVLVYNSSAANRSFNLGAEECAVGEVGEANTVNTDGMNYAYIKFEIDTGNYTCTIPDAQNYIVLDSDMESIGLLRYSNGNFEFENSGDIIYIGILADEGEIDVYLSLSEYSYTWKVDGNVVDSNNVELERGNSYTIEFYINGIEQGNDFITYIDKDDKELAEGVNVSGDRVTLMDYCPTGRSFKIKYSLSASAESKSGLTITPKYTVTFEGIASVTNEEELAFNWVQTDDLAVIHYTISNGSVARSGAINVVGYTTGKVYSEDLTKFTSVFGISYATITIDQIGVSTSKGVDTIAIGSNAHFTAFVHMAYGGGNGINNDEFIISSNRHFKNLELSNSNSNYFIITKYLSLKGNVIDNFYGVIDNEDNAIIGWKPTDSREMGIILHNFGTIRSIQVKIDYDFELTGMYGHKTGGIVCYNESDGVIEDCTVSMLRGSNLGFTSVVGGIVGVNDGTIRDCWAVVDVTTSGTFGVIAGANYGTITGCCGMGNIIQRVDTYEGCYELSKVGGIAGVNGTGGKISNCIGGTRDDSYLRVVIDVEYNDDENLAPYSGPIAGENRGEISNCSNYGYAIDTGNLHKWWAWFHDYDQLKNINNTI